MVDKEIRNNQGMHRLVDTYSQSQCGPFEEEALYRIALYIEDNLQTMGAEPGKDYTYLDIAKLAMEQTKINAMKELAESIEDAGNSVFAGLAGIIDSLDGIAKIKVINNVK